MLRSRARNLLVRGFLGKFARNLSNGGKDGFVVTSPAKEVIIPDMLLHEFMWSGFDKWHDKDVVECAETGRKLKYAEVRCKSESLAGFIQRYGLSKGDTVAIVLPNVPEYLIVLLGALQAGLTITPVNPIYTPEEIKRQLIRSESKMIFTLNSSYATVKQAVESIPGAKLPVVAIKHTQNEEMNAGCINLEEICAAKYEFMDPGVRPGDVCLLPFSSGTTGLPKGVQLTHRNLVANIAQTGGPEFKVNVDTDANHQDIFPLVIPMFHLYGLAVVIFTMFSKGGKFITLPKFNLKGLYDTLHKYDSTVFYAVPPIILMLLNNPELKLESLNKLRTVLSAAAPLGAQDIERFAEKTRGGIKLAQLYGLSECSPITHHQSFMLDHGVKAGGSGFTVANTLCKIVAVNDPDCRGMGPNMSGELLCKGPQVMKGYLHNEEANRQIFTEDGWIRTGDIGHYDEHEHFFITDRLKELIKVKGYQVAPAELEEVLRAHPDVADTVVIGVPDDKDGELPKAYIVLTPGAKTTPEDIHKYMSKQVVKYKQLTGGIEFIEKVPRNPSGKILRRLFRQ